jgi:hypothetical protein
MENKIGAFEQYLIDKNIPYEKDGSGLWVSDDSLIMWEDELLATFPEFNFDEE